MLTKVRCTCGQVMDATGASPGDEVECYLCGKRVRVPALPPGVGALSKGRAVDPVPSRPGQPIERERGEFERAPGLDPAAPPPPSDYIARHAVASNPADTRVEWVYYYRCYPAQLAVSAGMLALGVAGAVAKHPAMLILAAAGVGAFVLDVIKVRRKFRIGNVCPAVVVSEQPPLVAIGTDLAIGGSPRPVVKIARHPLKRLPGGVPQVGARLAAVAVYYPPVRDGAWSDFEPDVLCCATTNELEVDQVTASLGEQDWQALDECLAQCPPTHRPGLYTLWDTNAQGRRRSRARWVGTLEAVGALAIAAALLVWYTQQQEPTVPPNAVPGRVHTDWGR